MAKSTTKAPTARSQLPGSAAKPRPTSKVKKVGNSTHSASVPSDTVVGASKPNQPDSGTKQSRVISMLRSPAGASIAAIMDATGWQQHSVRGFLAGVVRKRLKLKLTSKKVEGTRLYRIDSRDDTKAQARQPKRRAA